LHVNKPLVGGAPETEVNVPQGLDKGAVYKNVCGLDKGKPAGAAGGKEIFPEIAGEGHNRKAQTSSFAGEERGGFRLGKGVAAGKGNAVQQGIHSDFAEQFFNTDETAAFMALQAAIVAAGAAKAAALNEYRITKAGPVND
jgi:hypothetical protein